MAKSEAGVGKIRWGIIGAGRISNDFVAAMTTLPAEHHQVIAVAARDVHRAEEFAGRFGIAKAVASYEELAEDPEIDVVYIGTVNPEHVKMCRLMLNHDKHVVCEKPLTLHLKDTVELFNLAKKKGRLLMEAIWSRCFPAYQQLKQEVTNRTIGDPYLVIANFGMNFPEAPGLSQRALGGGVLVNVGCYALQLANLVFQNEKPVAVRACATLNSDGVDETTVITLQYSDGALANFIISVTVELASSARIIGSEGDIEIKAPFLAPTEMKTPHKNYHYVLPFVDQKFPMNYMNASGLAYEAEEVRQCILAGKLECPWMTAADSIWNAEIIEEICKQIKVNYD
ncbi:hypothetical protein RvY_04963 [Ramazzottius varieornatus]|uniref:Trans-1,2-dihydrobenzene-1,2-diol dehydrogenase n=1 Tax=Ramazzottius varieornatus TaxID=947166 RepID=A0A1D1V2J4_RAMVA|nr:hypothetical protein RvY_04963 [Ramazzottius varieornatus]